MFLRQRLIKQNGKQYKYYQIVENKRVKGKVRQRLVLSLGDFKHAQQIAKVTTPLIEDMGLIDLDTEVVPQWSKEYGLAFVYQRIFETCGLADILLNLASRHKKLGFDLTRTSFNLILSRLMEPASEHRIAQQWNKTVYEKFTRNIELHHLYRTVRLLARHKEEIEQSLFGRTRDLFHQQIDLAFFDTTSTYLNGSQSEQLAQYGHSRDKRGDRKQLIIGVLLGPDSIPIGCQILPGNTADVEAMTKIIKAVKGRFSINKIILVSDGGMNSKDNRDLLEDKKLEYILGTRMKSIKVVREYLENHYPLRFEHSIKREGKAHLKYKEVFLGKQRYVIVYNPREAERQKQTREEIINKLKKQLKEKGLKSLIKNRGQRKYLKINDEIIDSATIDQDKVKKEKLFDGLFVCETNTGLKARDIVIQYKNLWQVERAFRNLKDIIEMQPIYHQADTMIKGHIFISFLGLYLEMFLKKQLVDNDVVKTDIDELMAEVREIKAVKLQIKNKSAVMRTELGENTHQLFKALSIRPPDRILEKWKQQEKM